MAEAANEERYRPYREAIRRRVCAVCLDSGDDGSCRLSGVWICGLDTHLPQLVQAARDVRQGQETTFEAALESRVCRQCPERETTGACPPRGSGRCALMAYLPLIVRAIEEVDGGDHRA